MCKSGSEMEIIIYDDGIVIWKHMEMFRCIHVVLGINPFTDTGRPLIAVGSLTSASVSM